MGGRMWEKRRNETGDLRWFEEIGTRSDTHKGLILIKVETLCFVIHDQPPRMFTETSSIGYLIFRLWCIGTMSIIEGPQKGLWNDAILKLLNNLLHRSDGNSKDVTQNHLWKGLNVKMQIVIKRTPMGDTLHCWGKFFGNGKISLFYEWFIQFDQEAAGTSLGKLDERVQNVI